MTNRTADATTVGKKRRAPPASKGNPKTSSVDCLSDGDELFEDGSFSQQHNVRDIKSKVSDFTRFVDGITAENATNKKELVASQTRIQQLLEKQSALLKEINEHKLSNDRLHHIVTDQESSIEELRGGNADLQTRIDNFANESEELANLRAMVATVKSQLKDYITLESTGSSLITTTGQVSPNSIIKYP